MKSIIKKIIIFKLKIIAKILLWRKKPRIFAITGSAGKTTTKEFLAQLLRNEYSVKAASEGYNTEIGAVLSLFSEKAPQKPFSYASFYRWLGVIFRCGWKAITIRDFPEILIVEMGADKSGDIKYLTSIFHPEIGIVLKVLPVHMEQFKNIEAIALEKSELVAAVPIRGKVILNADDENVINMAKRAKAKVVTFGEREGADYQVMNLKSDMLGLRFDLKTKEGTYQFAVGLYGPHMVYPLVASVVVAAEEGISFEKIRKTAKSIKPFKGRMNMIPGKNGSLIIDDSYNANPESTIRALEFLGQQSGRKIAVLGNMNELGEYEKEGHEAVGRQAAKSTDLLITVGDTAKQILAKEAVIQGLNPKKVHSFVEASEAGKWLKKYIRTGDIVLVKGSQNKVRLEKAIKYFMDNPEKASKILVRQSDFWQDKA